MSLQHFFLESQVLSAETDDVFTLRLSDEDAKHLRVLRASVGEHIGVIDAAKDYFECEIVGFDSDMPRVKISRRLDVDAAHPTVVLIQGLAKGDRFEEVLRHATELGVSAFVPFVCQRSVVKLDPKKLPAKMDRWRSIVKSAAMQSGQIEIPEVLEPMSLSEICKAFKEAHALLIFWEEAEGSIGIHEAIERALNATRTPKDEARIAIVVGPEGGLTSDEVGALRACNLYSATLSLGRTILRTETAGVVASALTLYELGALGIQMGCKL